MGKEIDLNQRFPSIQKYLRENSSYDLTKDMIPIIPVAHYTCGGVATDLYGRTNIIGLYCAGEAACTGLHGGNRLASTSLLEGLVFGASIADYVGGAGADNKNESEEGIELARQILSNTVSIKDEEEGITANNNNNKVANINERTKHLMTKLRKTMWDNVGLIRKPTKLKQAMDILKSIREEADDLLVHSVQQLQQNNNNRESIIGLRDAAYASEAVTLTTLKNRKSAGAHYIINDDNDIDGSTMADGNNKNGDDDDRIAMY